MNGGLLRARSELEDGQVWAMVEASPDGMLLADEHGTMLLVNAQIEIMFGYDRGDLLGRPVEELLPESHRQAHTAHRTRYRAEPVSRPMGSGLGLRGRRSDGSQFPVEVSLSPVAVFDENYVVATVRDISERTALEAHTHAVLHAIDETHDGVFMFSPETLMFDYVNHGAVSQLGYTKAELETMTPLHIKPEFTEASFRKLLAPLLAGDVEIHVFNTLHRAKNGADRPVEIILQYPPPADDDQPRMLVATVRDISDRLEAENALQRQQSQLRILEDRERLARDLHDLVIQRLFAAGIGLQSVQPLIDDPKAAERVAATVNQLDDTITELRTAIFRLNVTPELSVKLRLDEVIDHAEASLGFRPSLTIKGDVEQIADAVVEELLPTLTEILSNVARHANATATEVSLSVAETVDLQVIDDGDGCRPVAGKGSGLINIQQRARRLGGLLTISSEGGTTLRWTAKNPLDV